MIHMRVLKKRRDWEQPVARFPSLRYLVKRAAVPVQSLPPEPGQSEEDVHLREHILE